MVKRYWEPVPTNYIIDASWTVINPVPITEPAGWFSTKNWWLTLDDAIKLNWQSIHIEVVGTWVDTENPAEMPASQLKALKDLISNLKEQYPQATVTAHSLIDRNKWTCWQAILRTLAQPEPEPEPEPTKTITKKQSSNDWRLNISLSRYYSVMPDQEAYYGWRTYEQDFAINCHGDCLVTADWHQLQSSEAGLVVACPSQYPLGTKFYVEWLGTVTCHDRGWKIVVQWDTIRLDVRSWIGDEWRLNIQQNKIRTWKTRWYVVKD